MKKNPKIFIEGVPMQTDERYLKDMGYSLGRHYVLVYYLYLYVYKYKFVLIQNLYYCFVFSPWHFDAF